MTWAQTAKRYLAVFESCVRDRPTRNIASGRSDRLSEQGACHPGTADRAFPLALRQHGNAPARHPFRTRSRPWLLSRRQRARAAVLSALPNSGEADLPETITARFAAFIQHAWNPDTRRFRNFMSYDRRWLEDVGSEDSHGRTLWALAECARKDTDPSRRRWAAALFKTALPSVEKFSSPRAWAFTLLGLDAYCTLAGGDSFANRMRGLLADKLMSVFSATETKDWVWFEDLLAYDNARLPQALIQTGLTTHTPRTSRSAFDRSVG